QSAPAYRVSGIVVDENGSFVVGAMVMLMSDPRAGAMMGPAGSARSGDGGRFVIDGVVSGSYRATASIPMATNSGISRGCHGGPAADCRHDAVVAVAEGLERLSGDRAEDVLGRARPLLHRHLRDARQRLAVLHERAQVAGDEDIRMLRERERRFGRRAADAIERDAERLRNRRCRHAGAPQYGCRGNALLGAAVPKRHALLVYGDDDRV